MERGGGEDKTARARAVRTGRGTSVRERGRSGGGSARALDVPLPRCVLCVFCDLVLFASP